DKERVLERKLKYFNNMIEWEYTIPYRKGNKNIITLCIVTTRRPSVIQYNQVPQAPNKRLKNKEKIDQERHRLEELVQRLVEEIKEKLI
ncbi:31670_t:CDS:2, partial [Gigaspora margarita]